MNDTQSMFLNIMETLNNFAKSDINRKSLITRLRAELYNVESEQDLTEEFDELVDLLDEVRTL